MKKIGIVLGLMLFASVLFAPQAQSQALVVHDRGWSLGPVLAYDAIDVTTPSGNVNVVIKFQLPEGHPWIPEKGSETYPFSGFYWGLEFTGHFTVNSKGRLQYNFSHKANSEE